MLIDRLSNTAVPTDSASQSHDPISIADYRDGATYPDHVNIRQAKIKYDFIGDKDRLLLSKLLEPLLETDATGVTHAAIKYFGSIGGVITAEPHKLASVDGMTEEAIACIKLIHEITCYVATAALRKRDAMDTWSLFEAWLKINLGYSQIEIAKCLFLDQKNKLIIDVQIGTGSPSNVQIYPREIARLALEHHASSVLLAHNHPSGNPTPSKQDIAMTQQVITALATIDVVLHDHAIVGRDQILSMRAGKYI